MAQVEIQHAGVFDHLERRRTDYVGRRVRGPGRTGNATKQTLTSASRAPGEEGLERVECPGGVAAIGLRRLSYSKLSAFVVVANGR